MHILLGLSVALLAGLGLTRLVRLFKLPDVLFSVLIYDLIGPSLTRMALLKAGEIEESGAVSARGEKIHFRWRQR